MKTRLPVTLACILTFALFACSDTVDGTNNGNGGNDGPTPEPIVTGIWNATTGTGLSFDFTVGSTADRVTGFVVHWTDWICGSPPAPHGNSESYVVSGGTGWNITDRTFKAVVQPNATLYPSLIITISGGFVDDGMNASGSWGATEADQVCAGTWTAVPDTTRNSL